MKRFAMILLGCLLAGTSVQAGEPGVKQTIAYVQKLQAASGGFRSHEPKPDAVKILPTLRATSAAVRALKYLGGDVPNQAACVKFVESCWNAEAGAFSDEPKGKPDVFATAVGLMAVTELNLPTEKYAKAALKYLSDNAESFEDIRIAAAGLERLKAKSPQNDRWQGEVKKLQSLDGIFGKELGQARATGGGVVTMLRLGAKYDDSAPILKVLKAGQRQNGGWGKADSETASDLDTTYRVMRCFMMLKARPDNVEGLRSFVAKCRNEDGGYGIAPGQLSSVGGTYFAAIITHWLK